MVKVFLFRISFFGCWQNFWAKEEAEKSVTLLRSCLADFVVINYVNNVAKESWVWQKFRPQPQLNPVDACQESGHATKRRAVASGGGRRSVSVRRSPTLDHNIVCISYWVVSLSSWPPSRCYAMRCSHTLLIHLAKCNPITSIGLWF